MLEPSVGADEQGTAGLDRAGVVCVAALAALAAVAPGRGWVLFGEDVPDAESVSLLRLLPDAAVAPLLAAGLLATALALAGMASAATSGRRRWRARGPVRSLVLAGGWAVVGVLLLVVPDVRLLAVTGYAPMLVLGAPFGWPPVDYAEVLTPELLFQAGALPAGLLTGRTLLRWQRRTGGRCLGCGKRRGAGPTSGLAIARWSRWAVGVAVAVPLLYAVTRFAWVLGVPLGIPAADLRVLQATGGVWAGAGLGAFAVVGAGLSLGLVQRWGEVIPARLPVLGGRGIPPMLVVLPAGYVAILVTAAGLALLSNIGAVGVSEPSMWFVLPHALWPAWGAALAVATYSYHLRRRPPCPLLGRLACAGTEATSWSR